MNIVLFLVIDIIGIIILASLVSYFYKVSSAIKIEKRISTYSVTSLKRHDLSFFDLIRKKCLKIINKLSSGLSKIKWINTYSMYYEKYKFVSDYTPMNLVTIKFIMGIVGLIIAIFTPIFKLPILKVVHMTIWFSIGYMALDVVLNRRLNQQKKAVKNNLIKAIAIMSNSLSTDSNILLAIDEVTKKLSGAIAIGFNIVKNDLIYGLDIDKAFAHLYDIIQLEEINYIANLFSVTIKNGGDISNALEVIKLNLLSSEDYYREIKAKIELSKWIKKVSLSIPIVVIIVIFLVNRDYLRILFSTYMGIVLLSIIVLLFSIYILIINGLINGGVNNE